MPAYIYFREDLARVLSNVDMSSEGETALVDEEIKTASQNGQQLDHEDLVECLRIYRRGYEDALSKVALAFGIVPNSWTISADAANPPKIKDLRLLTWER